MNNQEKIDMDHKRILGMLPAYCGEDLSVTDKQDVERHLADCPQCRAELELQQRTMQLICSQPKVEPPPWLTSRIMANIADLPVTQRGWLKRLFFPLSVKLPLEAMALLAICATGYYMTRNSDPEMESAVPQLHRPQNIQKSDIPDQIKKETDIPATAPTPTDSKPPAPAARIRQVSEPHTAPQAPKQTPAPVAPSQPAPATVSRPAPSAHSEQTGSGYAPAPPDRSVYREVAPQKGYETEAPAPRAIPEESYRDNSITTVKKAKKAKKSSTEFSRTADAPAPAAKSAIAVETVRLQLKPHHPEQAADDIRRAVIDSGGNVTGGNASSRWIRARIQGAQIPALLVRLEKLGGLNRRPEVSSEMVEVVIYW